MADIYLGSHVPLKSPSFFEGSALFASSLGANTFMFYTGAPQNSFRLPLEEMKIQEGKEVMKRLGIDNSKIVVHAPYIINLANPIDETKREFGIAFLKEEIKRTAAFGAKWLVLHPGSSMGKEHPEGIMVLRDSLNKVLQDDENDVTICLETMAGKGSEIGVSFEEMALIIEGIEKKDRIGITMDTCHMNDAGYDISNVKITLDEFDRKVGIDKLKVVHLNDSLNIRGSHKDRHANIGLGTIGFDSLYAWVHEERLKGLPIILETPYIKDIPPYKKEIEMLLSGEYDPDWYIKLPAD